MRIPEPIKNRRSIRTFNEKEVSDELIFMFVKAACYAPSAGNRQPWEFIVVKAPETKKLLAKAAYGQSFIEEASVVFVVCVVPERSASRYGGRGRTLYCIQDSAAAIQNLILTATANGLGSCWVGAFDEVKAAEAVNLPEGARPIALVPVGYSNEKPLPRPRRPVKRVLHREKW